MTPQPRAPFITALLVAALFVALGRWEAAAALVAGAGYLFWATRPRR